MCYMIRKAEPKDDLLLANIQTISWRTAFKNIMSDEMLEEKTNIEKVRLMYNKLTTNHIGYGYILFIDNNPHCIAWWNKAQDEKFNDCAELLCIHSLPDNWHKGFGTKMMEYVFNDIQNYHFSKVILWVFEENQIARKFYEHLGFILTGDNNNRLGPREICYVKEL